ncbi:hypothetical protein H0H93_010567 [Arthromyces matolae]|nr:hypothetical protein H0H93_010567 [Arthromyces matolae]
MSQSAVTHCLNASSPPNNNGSSHPSLTLYQNSNPIVPNCYRIDRTSVDHGRGTGMGMFATCDMEIGDFVFAENPVVFVLDPLDTNQDKHERLLGACVSRMDEPTRDAFFELHNGRQELGEIMGRIKSNEFPIVVEEDEESEPFAAISLKTARINHNCNPNVVYHFDEPSFSIRVHAIRPISSGEQLFRSYCNHHLPRSERHLGLKPYGFTCTCPACSDPEWDDDLSKLEDGLYQPTTQFEIENPDIDTIISESMQWIKTIEEVGLQSHRAYYGHLLTVGIMAQTFGSKETGRACLNMAQKIYFANVGSDLAHLIEESAREAGNIEMDIITTYIK